MSCSFVAKTVQSGIFKTTVEALKEIITDGNFILDDTGIGLTAMSSSQTVLVNMKLEAEKFEHYDCAFKQIIGINTINLFKLIKTMTNNDTLTLFIEVADPNVIGIKIENADKNSITTFKLNLLDIDQEELTLPNASFESVITMPSVDFQKYCRDMSNIGEVIDIKSIGQQLILSCAGDFASQQTVIGENNGGLSLKSNDQDNIVQGLFLLRYLVLFTKCTNLSNQCQLFLKNNFPLVIAYMIANLGSIKLLLAPHQPSRI